MQKKISIYCIALSMVFMTQLICCVKKEKEEQKEDINTVGMLNVVKKEMAIPFHTTGIVTFKTISKLSFKTNGIIDQIAVEEGDSVSNEEILATLDLSEINAAVQRAKGAHAKAKRDLSRVENLYKTKAAALEILQNAKTALELTESSLNVALFNQRYSTIKAPSSGIILKRFKEENELVSAGTPLFLFAPKNTDYIIRIGVVDRELVRINIGDYAEVLLDAYPDEILSARITEINKISDPVTGLYEVELLLEKNEKFLFAGLVAKVKIIPSVTHRFFAVPMEALVEGDGNAGFVFTVNRETQKAVKIPVTVVGIVGDIVAVQGSLEAVEDIVVSGAYYLKDGDSVKILLESEE